MLHAGTRHDDDGVLSCGGRVLSVTAVGSDLAQARARAYAGVDAVSLRGSRARTDVGLRAERGEIAVPRQVPGQH